MAATNDGTRYELRLAVEKDGNWQLQIYQMPSIATPRVTAPEHVASLKGTALRLIENRILKRLSRASIRLGSLRPGRTHSWNLDEETALTLGVLFRVLAPMRNLDRIRQVADGVENMSREELGYWLGMVLHRRYPRRVLAALRILLTTP